MKFLKRILLFILSFILAFSGSINVYAANEPYVKSVIATYGEESKNVLNQVMEIDGGVMDDISIKVNWSAGVSGYTYSIAQYDDSTRKRYDLVSAKTPEFKLPIDDMYADIPLYIMIHDSKGNNVFTRVIFIRVNKGRVQEVMPEGFESVYKTNVELNMDELIPGMNFQMHPYFLPITAKVFTDGRMVIGLGINSSNVSFWKDARNGTIKENTDIKELSDVFWGNSANKSAVKGRNMGLVVDFAGSVQGNIYTNEPMKGKITAYIGSGFAVTGQYLILTWDITVTVGAGGVFEFQLKYNEETDKYSEFEPEKFSIQFKTGLELYGGIGLSSIASAGIYGAGSMTGVNTFYPKGTVDSLVLAGECGFKVKLFSRTLFSFAIWSGEHEFVQKTGPKLNLSNIEKIDSMLIAGNYASKAGSISEPESGGLWLSNGSYLKLGSDLKGYESDSDFEHIIAKDIYPENRLLTVKTGSSNFPQINVVLLGSDGSRANGNRSRLMNFYFDENKNFISEPVWMFDTDDGTADFDPYAYHSEESGNTYTVWKNAVKELSESASFREIAENTDIYFSKFQVSSSWYAPERITDYAERNEGVFATGARVSENASGSPVVTWFTNPVDDPAGVGSSEHSIMLAVKNGTAWESEEAFKLKGVQVTNVDYTVFGGK
ncbi:MAG: hypothetical protein II749_03480, partial [Clostridia bacterium]|nr:hypothetical protein [Clostridia bacterium]